jgi:hypothetical protein
MESTTTPDKCPLCQKIEPGFRPAVCPHTAAGKQQDLSFKPNGKVPEPQASSYFEANGVKTPLSTSDSPGAIARHLAETARKMEDASQHPERGLTPAEQANFDRRVGTVEQRIRVHRMLPNASTLAYSLANLFTSNPIGSYRRHDDGSYHAIRQEVTVLDFLAHIDGRPNRGLLCTPILPSGNCHWGAIDLDRTGEKDEPVDWPALARRVSELKLPLVVCRSKGGKGAWLFIFFKDENGVPAGDAGRLLAHYAQRLDLRSLVASEKNLELFPKQEELKTEKRFGSGINLPYRLSLDTFTCASIAFGKDGEPLELRDFINLASERRAYGCLLASRLPEATKTPAKLEEPIETTVEAALEYLDRVCAELVQMTDGRKMYANNSCLYLGGIIAGLKAAGLREPGLEFKVVTERIKSAIRSTKPAWPNDRYVVVDKALEDGLAKQIKIVPDDEIEIRDWPEPPVPEVFAGLVGDFTRVWEPHTEASPVSMAAQFITVFGHAVGREPFFVTSGDDHHTNLELALVGPTAFARKGQSYNCVKRTFDKVELSDMGSTVINEARGLSSGEGLIYAVRDSRSGPDKKGRIILLDEGVPDKRLLVVETEFASVLRRMSREGNTLSEVLRQIWDSGNLGTMTKNTPLRATNAHVSLITHVTPDDLRLYLNYTSARNGFANRFVFLATRRVRSLSDPGRPSEVALRDLAKRLASVIEFGQSVKEMKFTPEAKALWDPLYTKLGEPRTGRMHNAVVARCQPIVLRLSMIYALLDQSRVIEARHLTSAAALWDYAERTSRFVFGDSAGDHFAEKVLEILKAEPNGLTTREIRQKVSDKKKVTEALQLLHENGQVRVESLKHTAARRGQRWFAGHAS